MSGISFITGSTEKFSEAKIILPDLIRIDCDLPEIQELDQKKIIAEKLKAAREQGFENIVVEDTGLYFKSLNFALPGPLIKWFVKSMGNDGLYALARCNGEGETNQAFALTTIGYLASPACNPIFFEGRIDGTVETARGGGFGWDAIFQPLNSTRTLGEMPIQEKTAISHRGRAFTALERYLIANN